MNLFFLGLGLILAGGLAASRPPALFRLLVQAGDPLWADIGLMAYAIAVVLLSSLQAYLRRAAHAARNGGEGSVMPALLAPKALSGRNRSTSDRRARRFSAPCSAATTSSSRCPTRRANP